MRRFATALAALALAGCAGLPFAGEEDDFEVPRVCGPEHTRLPCKGRVELGESYRFNLLTHCGIEWAYFDGRYWVPRPKVDPPPDWADIEAGTMELFRRDEAVFEADKGGGARFVPAEVGFRPEVCA